MSERTPSVVTPPPTFDAMLRDPSEAAELVGLRTEVDQLRSEQEQLRQRFLAEQTRADLREAERDALQAEVEALRRENSVLQHAIDCPPRDVAKQRAIKQVAALQARIDAALVFAAELRQQGDWLRNGHRASDYGWDIDSALRGLPVAALGVDPQKETQR